MLLRAIGQVADVKSENRTFPSGDKYVEHKVWVQTSRTSIVELVLDKDFPTADIPRLDEEVDFDVKVSAFSYKSGGTGQRYTAVSRRFEQVPAAVKKVG